jgi:hypothetical protein
VPSIRKSSGYRPDDTESELLRLLAQKTGLPVTRIIGLAVRELAAARGVQLDPQAVEPSTAASSAR